MGEQAESKVVAVLGDAFPFEQSWVEKMARELADSLGLKTEKDTPPTFSFEDSYLVGTKGIFASMHNACSGNLTLSYERHLPDYNLDSANSNSQQVIKETAETFHRNPHYAIGLATKYFSEGPFEESLVLRNQHLKVDDHGRADVTIYRCLKHGNDGEDISLSTTVDNRCLADFVEHLKKAEKPIPSYFAEEFGARIVEGFVVDEKTRASSEYKSSIDPKKTDSYITALAEFIRHVAEF
ncbi:hypothetical protein JW707_02980 [Candidatus Woesearchaeota archaeon]|nr:hypothetical protein [Candidatus Woesearchaeota archaeon]